MGMWFDRLCLFVEQNNANPSVSGVISLASLFEFKDSIGCFNKIVDEDEAKKGIDNFFLPFDVTAIEDIDGLQIFMGENKDKKDISYIEAIAGDRGNSVLFDGSIHDFSPVGLKIKAEISLRRAYLVDKRMRLIKTFNSENKTEREFLKSQLPNMGQRIVEGLAMILKINQPQHFIVEESPTNKTAKHKVHLRTNERPTFTYLTIGGIKKRFGLSGMSDGDGGTKSPHPRRAHSRTLHSDRFKNKQGQTIVIPACWVGPEEKQVGNKIYRVRLDV